MVSKITFFEPRWEPFHYTEQEKYEIDRAKKDFDENSIGGLQLFFNLDMVSKAFIGKKPGLHGEEDYPINQPGLDPKSMILGCHRTSDNMESRGFATGRMDEVAYWAWRLNDTEMPYFLGGYSKMLNIQMISEDTVH